MSHGVVRKGCILSTLLMQAIWEELQDTVHAVDAMVTKTPEEMS